MHLSSLQSLSVGWNKIGKVGAARLGEAIKHLSMLQSLNVSGNQIGDAGVASLVRPSSISPACRAST